MAENSKICEFQWEYFSFEIRFLLIFELLESIYFCLELTEDLYDVSEDISHPMKNKSQPKKKNIRHHKNAQAKNQK